MKNTLTLMIVLFGTISTLFAQTNKPTLVKDIKAGVDGSSPIGFAQLNNKTYFIAEGDFNSIYTAADRRLFSMTNGASMPQIVPFNFGGGMTVDANLAAKSPLSLKNNLFLFVRRNNTIEEMWKTDGITSSLVDTVSNYGIVGSFNSTLASVYNDKFYLRAYYRVDDLTWVDLYRHTGERGGKQFVAKLNRNEVLPMGSFFGFASEEVDTYYPTPDVTYTDVTFDSSGGTNLRGFRRTIRAFDHTMGTTRDIYTVAWRGNYGYSTDLLTSYKIVGAVNSNLLFTSTARGTASVPADTLFSLDKMGVKTLLKTNIGSSFHPLNRGKTIVLGNRIIFLDDYNRIWESDGTAAGTRILPSNGAVEIYYANGQLFYLKLAFLPNFGTRTHVYAVGGAEIGSYESAEGEYDKLLVFQDNKNVFLVPQITQADTTKRLLIKLGDAQTPFKIIGPISKCKKDFIDPYKMPIDTTCPCLNLTNSAPLFTVVDSTLLFVAYNQPYGGEVWRMNLGTQTPPNPCATDTTKPIFANCPSNITTSTSTTCANVNWTPPTATDNCSTPSVSATHAPTFCFPIGTTTVVYTAKDGRNNQKTCSFLVTVNSQVSRCNLFSANTLVINNCPTNINLTAPTGSTCLAANWTPPTAVQRVGTDVIPVNLTSNFLPNYCFPIGSTNVIYTATDSCGNVKICNFTVTVTTTVVTETCKKYTVASTNSICNPATWQPFLLRNGANRYTMDALEFKEINATTATLKGSLRDASWQLIPIDLIFSSKSAVGTPQLINCLTPSVSTANWAYYPTVSGTITLPTGVIVVNSATNALQIGTSANTQNVGELGGYAKIGNATMSFDLSFKLSNPVNITCDGVVAVNCSTDTIPPVLFAIPANVTADCFATALPPATVNATDNCTANVRIQFQEVRGTDFLLRTWTAIDTRGNASTATQRITILDRNPPVISNCPATVNATTTATCTTVTWTPPTATDVCGTPILLPNLPVNTCFSIGTTPVIYTATDVAGNSSTCRFNVIVTNGTMSSGLDMRIVATPSEYRFWTPINYRISLKNNGLTTSNGIKIVFEPADLQSGGGTATASVGTFNEYCSGGIACREWTIPSLAAGATATLDVPRFVLNPVGNLVSKARLLTPSISEATVTVTSAANALNGGAARLSRPKSTQLVPVIIQYISPNPTLGDLEIELESLTERDVVFQFSDLIGNVVQMETRRLVTGFQIKTFDVSSLPQGVYFIQISTNRARNVPVKFIKM
jgi:HYR domain/Secretion system C-terminal sorting domain/Domain of unknown function DUF11